MPGCAGLIEMSVKIDLATYLQTYAGDQAAIEVEGRTVGECVAALVHRFPGIEKMLFSPNGKLHGYVGIYLNGEDIFPEELAKPVKHGDEVHIMYLISGG